MAQTLIPPPGPAFADANAAPRPAGSYRIAGASRALEPEHERRLRASLGDRARLLDARRPGALIADFDACSLDGAPIATEADLAEVVRAYRLARLEGAFAIAWTDGAGVLHLARDPIGHRSVYYAVHDGQLVFASRLRPLVDAFGLPRRLDLRSVAAFLSYAYVPGRATMLDGVFELLPGETVTFANGRLARAPFWDLPADPPPISDPAPLRRALRTELERVIGAALPAGEPVCASLSGGIDSSLVVAIARLLHPHPVRTFSICFGDGFRNELPFSSAVAEHTGTEHHIVELRPEAIVAHFDDTIARMDKPNGDPLTVPNALLFREMSRHGAVVLNGEGGDPCFGGPKNIPMLLAELYGDGTDGDPAYARERSYLRAHSKCFDDLAAMLTPDAYATACTPPLEHDLAPWFRDPGRPSFVGMLMAINVRFKGGHHILPKVDALSEPFGVLPRSPLFSKSIVELSFRIPATLKLAGAVEKYLLKEAVRDLLPASIVDREKSGMLVPVEGWFQGALAAPARERMLDGLAKVPIFQPAMLEQLLHGKHLGLRPRRGVKIWLLLTLEAHLRLLGVQV